MEAAKTTCRICLSEASSIDLISPCRCTGTQKYVHNGCIMAWIRLEGEVEPKKLACEICGSKYRMKSRRFFRPRLVVNRKSPILALISIALIMFACGAVASMLKYSHLLDNTPMSELHIFNPGLILKLLGLLLLSVFCCAAVLCLLCAAFCAEDSLLSCELTRRELRLVDYRCPADRSDDTADVMAV
ncbi:hypothetical protein BOX15_Mlig024090g3 [Macrostomum lignano]|uniref:RING-CH-type domain-containing protein n=1 Tax=Macrostomum lignano TaxID=282301 RepID=A0A267FJL5_9PLAT|nr:hypothetical protein BOX15_Mlig024090g3 [Macrostomum lignano]